MSGWSDCPECGKCKKVPYNTVADGQGNEYWFRCFDCGYWENYTNEIYDKDTKKWVEAPYEVRSGYEKVTTCDNCERGMRVSKIVAAGKSLDDPPEKTEYACGVCFFCFQVIHQDETVELVRLPLRDIPDEKQSAERFTGYPINYEMNSDV